jgi:hypothetical protein
MNFEINRLFAPARGFLAVALCLSACSDPSYPEGESLGAGMGKDSRRVGEAGTSDGAVLDGATGPLQASDASVRRDAGQASERDRADAARAPSDPPTSTPEDADAGTSTPPVPSSDAGPATSPGPDADAPDVVALPAWANELPGQYAMHAIAFSQDDIGYVIRADERSLVTIEARADGMYLSVRACELVSRSEIASSLVDRPEALAIREHRLRFTADDHFTTEPLPAFSGYQREVPAGCERKENQLVAKQTEQAWIEGDQCRCPSAPESPVTVDDCRVHDPDNDQEPGLKVSFKGEGVAVAAGRATVHGVVDHQSKFVLGRLRADKTLYAEHTAADTSTQLRCMPRGCTNVTSLSKPCPSSFNRAEFVRLTQRTEGWNCTSLLPEFGRLFTGPAMPVPSSCL